MPSPETVSRAALRPRTGALLDALETAWGTGKVDVLDTVLAPFFVRQGHNVRMSRDELKRSILSMRGAFPDLTMTVVRVVEGEVDVAMWWTSTGTHSDAYLELPPTGRRYAVSGVTFATFAGDVVVRESVLYDHRGEHGSLGVPLRGAHGGPGDRTTIGADALRAMHRKLVTGVTVVTADADGEPRGLAVNAFSSVSLEPPLILICVQKTSSTYEHLIASQSFGVNILAAHQLCVARVFATKQERKFNQVAWHRGKYGAPLIDGACACLEAELQDTLHAHTHTIFVGRVQDVTSAEVPPLVYARGEFFDGGQLVEATGP